MHGELDPQALLKLAHAVLTTEADAIVALESRLDEQFVHACQLMFECKGRVIVIGMGKSGHIGSKIAATLASTGTPAFFVHPAEASHGDLGMITPLDVVLALSNSGETDELIMLLPIIKRLAVPLIALTGRPESRLARAATVHINVGVAREACPLGLAPTASTTATLAMGDALAVALLEARGFTESDFARSHPAGTLGRRLLLRIVDVMHSGDRIPHVLASVTLGEALLEMSRKGLGMTTIVDEQHRLIGIFTDGDLRRLLDHSEIAVQRVIIAEVMTRPCCRITPDHLAVEALQMMQNRRINALPVTLNDGTVVGALNMHDLLRAGVV
jgi:arabinose-5-phosphate isomerase